jgi:hypothetical protein
VYDTVVFSAVKSFWATSHRREDMRFLVVSAVKMLIVVLWAVLPCGHGGGYQNFGGRYCFYT